MQFSEFSKRFGPNSGILQLMNDLDHAINADHDICMLGGGNPAAIAEMESFFRKEMIKLLENGNDFEKMVGNYDSPQGNTAFIDALAELMNTRFNWPLTGKNIAITNGSQASFGMLFNLFSGKFPDGGARNIVLPLTPEYIGYSDVGLGEHPLFKANRPNIEMNLPEGDLFFKYRIDFNSLNIDNSCGAVCVSRPTNPTGNIVTDEELKTLSFLTAEAGVPLIIDGAYGLPFPGMTFVDSNPIWDKHIILCLSLSKLGLPGARTGVVIADESLIELLTGFNAIFNLAPGRFGPALMTDLVKSNTLISLCESIIRPYYKLKLDRALDLISSYMCDLPVRIHKPEGAMFLWLWFDNISITSESLYGKLKQRGVYVIAGQHFFPGLEGDWKHKNECIRVSYAGDPLQMEKGIGIIAEEVRRAYDKNHSSEVG